MSEEFKSFGELYMEVFGEETEPDEEVKELSNELRDSFADLVNSYYEEDGDNDLNTILLDDESQRFKDSIIRFEDIHLQGSDRRPSEGRMNKPQKQAYIRP